MILCFDIGNSHIFGGVIQDDKIILQFRYASNIVGSSDQLGLFFTGVLAENNIDPKAIERIAACSVVPSLDYTFTSACIKYFNMEPFMLKPGVKTGLMLAVKNPLEVGADRIANAIAAIHHFPNKNIIIADYGTATTHCAISEKKEFLGGVISPGLKISMNALSNSTAKLPPVEILTPSETLGKTTATNIQSGIYHTQLGGSRLIIDNFTEEVFAGEKPVVIGTGGFAHLFEASGIFDVIIPDLVLHGLHIALGKN